MSRRRVTATEYAAWLVVQKPRDTFNHPTQHYILGGARHFGISERRAERLYEEATKRLLVQRREEQHSEEGLYQWGGASSMADAVPSVVVWWEWREDVEHP